MIRVWDHREIKAVVLALKVVDRTLANDINRSTKAVLDPVWKGGLSQRAKTLTDRTVIVKGSRVKGGNPPALLAATSNRALSGGLVPSDLYGPIEFGGTFNKVTTYTRKSKLGGQHKVTRHTARQLPRRVAAGRVAYPTVAEIGPRAASLWVSMTVAKVAAAFKVGR